MPIAWTSKAHEQALRQQREERMRKDGFVRFSLLFACVTSIVWHVNSHSASSALLSLSALTSTTILFVSLALVFWGMLRVMTSLPSFFASLIVSNEARNEAVPIGKLEKANDGKRNDAVEKFPYTPKRPTQGSETTIALPTSPLLASILKTTPGSVYSSPQTSIAGNVGRTTTLSPASPLEFDGCPSVFTMGYVNAPDYTMALSTLEANFEDSVQVENFLSENNLQDCMLSWTHNIRIWMVSQLLNNIVPRLESLKELFPEPAKSATTAQMNIGLQPPSSMTGGSFGFSAPQNFGFPGNPGFGKTNTMLLNSQMHAPRLDQAKINENKLRLFADFGFRQRLEHPGQSLDRSRMVAEYVRCRLTDLSRYAFFGGSDDDEGYKWNGGGRWTLGGHQMTYEPDLPTDAEIMMHIFCTFLDILLAGDSVIQKCFDSEQDYQAARRFSLEYVILKKSSGRQLRERSHAKDRQPCFLAVERPDWERIAYYCVLDDLTKDDGDQKSDSATTVDPETKLNILPAYKDHKNVFYVICLYLWRLKIHPDRPLRALPLEQWGLFDVLDLLPS